MIPRLALFGLSLFILGGAALFANTRQPQGPGELCPGKSGKEFRECVEESLVGTLKRDGAQIALARLSELDRENPQVHADCHPITHTLGHEGYKKYGGIAEALAHGDMTCFAGYFHGVLEVGIPDVKNLSKELPHFCDAFPVEDKGFQRYQCVHGLGHGLVTTYDYDIFEPLSLCDLLTTAWDQTSCGGGVFMENANPGQTDNPPHIHKDDPIYPCLSVSKKHQTMCFSMTSAIVIRGGGDIAATFKTCETLERSEDRTYCYRGVGRAITGWTSYNAKESIDLCLAGPKEATEECLNALARGFVTNFADPSAGTPICSAIPSEYQKSCYHALGGLISSFGGNELSWRRECDKVARGFEDACYQSASGESTFRSQ
jgi:hypothetical protein